MITKKTKRLRAKTHEDVERLLYQHIPDGYVIISPIRRRWFLFTGFIYELIIEKTV